ncbi:MAG TPA: hypothetical protein VIN56_10805 [Candidatus Dormibacteraeota bacterium]|jgi:uncharacterized protein YgbK (DUF1537 family)
MKSVRLGDQLEGQLERASEVAGLTESEIIRRAVSNECAQILGNTVYDQMRDLIVEGGGTDSSLLTDEQIGEEMARDAARNRRVIAPRS